MLICVTISNKCPLRNWNFNGRTSKTNRFIKLFKNETKNKKKKNEENVDRSFKNETSPRQIKLHRKKQRNLTNCFFFTVSLSLCKSSQWSVATGWSSLSWKTLDDLEKPEELEELDELLGEPGQAVNNWLNWPQSINEELKRDDNYSPMVGGWPTVKWSSTVMWSAGIDATNLRWVPKPLGSKTLRRPSIQQMNWVFCL